MNLPPRVLDLSYSFREERQRPPDGYAATQAQQHFHNHDASLDPIIITGAGGFDVGAGLQPPDGTNRSFHKLADGGDGRGKEADQERGYNGKGGVAVRRRSGSLLGELEPATKELLNPPPDI
ncbi:MAG: hypothetical protein Q9207_008331 [Kuettlingeria erythrocarpa]